LRVGATHPKKAFSGKKLVESDSEAIAAFLEAMSREIEDDSLLDGSVQQT